MWIRLSPSACKISINVAFEASGSIGLEYDATISSMLEIPADSGYGLFVRQTRVVAEACCLMNSHGNVGAHVLA